uniref:Luciferin 4-monooxygenase n=1 Tax=Timema poppense TaxID=170557 RepID=A0A7R9DDU4_TIMPO|nr:unnamed protein product [Timema poppensis]
MRVPVRGFSEVELGAGRELEHALSISSPKLVLCSSDVAQKNTATLTGSDTVSEVLVWGEEVPLASKIFTSLEEVLASVDMADTVDTAKVNESTSENSGTESRTEVEKSDSSEHGSTARRLENFGWTEDSHYKDHVAFILGSSGSTGLPKGVMLTHNNIVAALTRREGYHQEVYLRTYKRQPNYSGVGHDRLRSERRDAGKYSRDE